MDREAVAYHEAGHAVVALHFGNGPDEASIIRDEDAGSLGHVRADEPFSLCPPGTPPEEATRRYREAIVGLYAGHEALLLVDPDAREAGQGGDEEKALDLAEAAGLVDELDALREEARALVSSLRPRIERVAAALLQHERLDGFQVEDAAEGEAEREIVSPPPNRRRSG